MNGRTVLALVIAFSVAILPAAGGAAIVMESAGMSVSEAMPDCCEHHGIPCDKLPKAKDGCCSMAACALMCFNFSASSFSDLIFPPVVTEALPMLATNCLTSQMGSPPFRPPRA